MTTRSPFLTPRDLSALASRQVRFEQLAVGDARDRAVVGLEDDRHLVAQAALDLRSRQLYETFSVPSSNHLKNGALLSSSTLVNGVFQLTCSRASRDQKPA